MLNTVTAMDWNVLPTNRVESTKKSLLERFDGPRVQIEEFIHQYDLHTGFAEDNCYRQRAESWYIAASVMVHDPSATQHFLSVLRKAQKKLTRDKDIVITLDHMAHPLLEQLQEHALLIIILTTEQTTTCLVPGGDCRAFLSGDWLKVYLWRQLTLSGVYDEVRWSVRLVLHAQMEYELDVLCLRDDALYLYECNTMADPIARSTIYLDLFQAYSAIFSPTPLHSYYVCIHPQLATLAHYDMFIARAQQQNISVFAGYDILQLESGALQH